MDVPTEITSQKLHAFSWKWAFVGFSVASFFLFAPLPLSYLLFFIFSPLYGLAFFLFQMGNYNLRELGIVDSLLFYAMTILFYEFLGSRITSGKPKINIGWLIIGIIFVILMGMAGLYFLIAATGA